MTENELKQVETTEMPVGEIDASQPEVVETTSKKKRRQFHLPTRKLCGMAVLTALAVTLACTVHIPFYAASFLEYSPSDVPILIASFMYGPIWGFVVNVIVALIQGFTVSASAGPIGIAMNLLSTGIFVLSAGLVYKFKRNLKGAIVGLVIGFVSGVVSMILWNILITPLYMNVPRDVVVSMIPTVFLPFNLLKYAGNAGLTFVLYKATGKLFKFAFGKVPDKTINDEITVDDLVEGKEFVSTSVGDTYDLAKRIASILEGGEVLLLDGDLGAGKTTFTKGLAKALGVKDEVTSPTFTIMNVYDSGRLKLNHLDMYRLEHEDDLYELGVEEAMDSDTVTVIEWNKLTALGDKVISIDIKVDKKKRIFKIRYENTCS